MIALDAGCEPGLSEGLCCVGGLRASGSSTTSRSQLGRAVALRAPTVPPKKDGRLHGHQVQHLVQWSNVGLMPARLTGWQVHTYLAKEF